MDKVPAALLESVLVKSVDISDKQEVKGYDFNQGLDYSAILQSYNCIGFQATHMAQAITELNRMLNWRLSDEPILPDDSIPDIEDRKKVKAVKFLAYTSNIISSGLREVIRYLVQHKLVDVVVTSGGGIEEDFIKCLAKFYIGDFHLNGKSLRQQGLNRIGNLLVPNENYCKFESWIMPIFDKMLEEQKEGMLWTPSKLIERLGREINNEESVYYWAAKNNIPVFCPGITDGSIGDMLYMHSYANPGLILDVIGDVKRINNMAFDAKHSGMFIIGGGVPKHHTNNANLMRNGADFSVNVNTGLEHEGSDSGAPPDEAVSWGKIKSGSTPIKLFAEATLVVPLIVAESFYKYHEQHKDECPTCSNSS
ncbi:unnamed protein product [Blepharisma stoltei]|uniref:deoxyhypusine synthase n=1 Tax=Blepharisma stoltei TaxID=1481888 RepID=A0AAU9ISF0_9CILI|nr:unnamed protein product [Blepharisma stoltei]